MRLNIRFLQLVFLIVLAVVIFAFFRQTDIEIFDLRFPTASELIFLLLSSIGLALMGAILWNEVANIIAGKRNLLRLAIVNNGLLLIGKYIPGKIWGVAARTIISRHVNISTGDTITISVVEFLSAIIFSAVVGFSLYLGLINNLGSLFLLGILITGCCVFVFSMMMNEYFIRILRKNIPRLSQLSIPDISVLNGLLIFMLLIIYWAVFSIGLVSLLHFLEINTGYSNILLVLSAYVFSVTAGFLVVIAPGGIGVREATFTGLCAGVLGLEKSVELAFYIRLWLTIFELGLGVVSMLIMSRIRE